MTLAFQPGAGAVWRKVQVDPLRPPTWVQVGAIAGAAGTAGAAGPAGQRGPGGDAWLPTGLAGYPLIASGQQARPQFSNTGVQIDSRKQAVATATDGSTVTFDLSVSTYQEVTLGGARTLAVSNGTGVLVFAITLIQDGSGSRTVTWFSTVSWPAGTTPTLTTTAAKRDTFVFIQRSAGAYLGFTCGQNL